MKAYIFQFIKLMLSYIYTFTCFRKKRKGQILISNKSSNIFFGYYDVAPFNPIDINLVCYHLQSNNSRKISIMVENIQTKEQVKIGTSLAWNYQQGTRLQWLNGDHLVFNEYDGIQKKFFSIVKNLKGEKIDSFPYPIESIYKEDFFLSIDFQRLRKSRTEYGYSGLDTKYPEGYVVFFDIKKRVGRKLFSENDCFEKLSITNKDQIQNEHINHILISPDGTSFIFIFRYFVNQRRVDNLLLYNILNDQLVVLLKNQVLSHFVWKSETDLFFWGIVNKKAGYFQFSILTNEFFRVLNEIRDGHPTFMKNDEILTDTYPNKFLRQELYTYNLTTKKYNTICYSQHPAFFSKEKRCDLHPSISQNGLFFQIDIIKKGKRAICIGRI